MSLASLKVANADTAVGAPIVASGRLTAIEQAIAALEGALNGSTPAIASSTGVTLTVAQIAPGAVILRSGAAAVSDTFPTAAQIVAAIPGAKAGQSYSFYIRNANSNTLTLAAPDSSVTLASGNTNTIATLHLKKVLVVMVTVTLGSEAVTIYTLEDTAY
jgi:hypothetical protein